MKKSATVRPGEARKTKPASRMAIFTQAWALAWICLLPVGGLASEFTFSQLDFVNRQFGYDLENSDFGRVTFSFSAEDASLFFDMPDLRQQGGHLNIVTQHGSQGNNWAVQNLPVLFDDMDELTLRVPQGVLFALNVNPGEDLTELNYGFQITATPLAAVPAVSMMASAVGSFEWFAAGGGYYEEGRWRGAAPDQSSPLPAQNLQGLKAGERVNEFARIFGNESTVAKIDEDYMGCVPGSIARGMRYLADMNGNVTMAMTGQQIYEDLVVRAQSSVGPVGTGTNFVGALDAKRQLGASHTFPVISQRSKKWNLAMQTIQFGGAVEMQMWWGRDPTTGKSQGSHSVFVSEIQEVVNASGKRTGYIVRYLDDKQGNVKPQNISHTIRFDTAGNMIQKDGAPLYGEGAKLIALQTQQATGNLRSKFFDVTKAGGFDLPAEAVAKHEEDVDPFEKMALELAEIFSPSAPTTTVHGLTFAYDGDPTNQPGHYGNHVGVVVDVLAVPEEPTPEPSLPDEIAMTFRVAHTNPDGTRTAELIQMLEDDPAVFVTHFQQFGAIFEINYRIALPGLDQQVFVLRGLVNPPHLDKIGISAVSVTPAETSEGLPKALVEAGPLAIFDVTIELNTTFGDARVPLFTTAMYLTLTAQSVDMSGDAIP